MNKITTISLEEELLSFWLKGWPEYCINQYDDYPSIRHLVQKVANHLGVNPSDPEGRNRCCVAIENIARYCKWHGPWAFRTLYFANLCFSRLYNEMKSSARLKDIKAQNYGYKK